MNILEKRFLRKIFGTGKDDVTEGWNILHNEELRVYTRPRIKVIKSARNEDRYKTWEDKKCTESPREQTNLNI